MGNALVGRESSAPVQAKTSGGPEWAQELRRWETQIGEIIPASLGIDPQQLIRVALTEVRNNAKLQAAAANNPASFVGAVMGAARYGLEIGGAVAPECYLIPRWNNRIKGDEVVLQPSVVGLAAVTVRLGAASKIWANVVYDGDEFDVMLGTDEYIHHRPNYEIDRADHSLITAAYSVAVLPNGEKRFDVMTRGQVEAIRDRYVRFGKDGVPFGPWADSFDQMARKTVMSRLVRSIPKAAAIGAVASDVIRVADPAAIVSGVEKVDSLGVVDVVRDVEDAEPVYAPGEEPFELEVETSG